MCGLFSLLGAELKISALFSPFLFIQRVQTLDMVVDRAGHWMHWDRHGHRTHTHTHGQNNTDTHAHMIRQTYPLRASGVVQNMRGN